MNAAPPDAEGLSEAQAAQRLATDGPNALAEAGTRSLARLAREVVAEPMFLLLVACGVIYYVLGDRGEALMLLGFVVIVMTITIVQQRRAEHALASLRQLASPTAVVVRGGVTSTIAARELVCGDIVHISEGSRAPADMLVLDSSNLAMDESMLTGESLTVAKFASAAGADPAAAAAAAASQVFAGTLVTQGTARARVTATGARSALGQIGASLGAIDRAPTPIERETRTVVVRVALAGLALAAALALLYWRLRGDWLHGLLAGLTLAMAVLPEELPVVLTIFLGLGAWRLAREKVLARHIPAIELLGATTLLCVDKTGTLTTNRMVVRALWNETDFYDAANGARTANAANAANADNAASAASAPGALLPEALHGVLEFAVLASHRRAFDPMESAIDLAGQQLLAHTEHLHGNWTLLSDYPLSREMLAMSRVWQADDPQSGDPQSGNRQQKMIALKGAPEAVIDLCHLAPARAARITQEVTRLAEQGLRVLGVGCARFDGAQLPGRQHDIDFVFLGLIALEDPVRADVPQAVAQCRQAGMRVVMITGDHPATARSIARQAGLATSATAAAISGAELATMDSEELGRRLAVTDIFCRIEPAQKLQLVQAFRAHGEVVAMTGDGVNDAPALKAADIGVAMGARGTDVAREAAALVLLDDNFSSLVTAVAHGRRVFANLRKAIVFVVAAHVPIVGMSILPVMLGWPILLMPVHILFLQLIIDPACSVIFEAEPAEPDAMRRPPRRPDARLFDRVVLWRGLAQGSGLLLGLASVGALGFALGEQASAVRATLFCVLVVAQLGLILVNRSLTQATRLAGLADNRAYCLVAAAAFALLALVWSVPLLRSLFAFAPPSAALAAVGACASVLCLVWCEAAKRWANRWEMRDRAKRR